MNELDFLKEHWKKTTNFPKKSKEELYTITQKKSSNLLKWIISINILEFIFFLSLSFFMPQDDIDEQYPFLIGLLTVISYLIPIYFIYNYIVLIRGINITQSTRELMKNILKTRKLLNQYITTNILLLIISAFTGIYISLNQRPGFPHNMIDFLFISVAALIFISFIVGIAFLFYRLIYGFFLRKLEKNYKELQSYE